MKLLLTPTDLDLLDHFFDVEIKVSLGGPRGAQSREHAFCLFSHIHALRGRGTLGFSRNSAQIRLKIGLFAHSCRFPFISFSRIHAKKICFSRIMHGSHFTHSHRKTPITQSRRPMGDGGIISRGIFSMIKNEPGPDSRNTADGIDQLPQCLPSNLIDFIRKT